jgi:hypothetical protein
LKLSIRRRETGDGWCSFIILPTTIDVTSNDTLLVLGATVVPVKGDKAG